MIRYFSVSYNVENAAPSYLPEPYMQCRSDLGPIGVGSHGEEVRWLPTFADTRHGIMVALRHLCEKSLC